MVQTEQSLITFYRDSSNESLYHIEIRDAQRASRDYYSLKRFHYESDIKADEGSLVVQENTVLIAPHNKMLNLINGVWYLNDFVSTTPVISVSQQEVEEVTNDVFVKALGSIVVTKFDIPTFNNYVNNLITTSFDVGTTQVFFDVQPNDAIYSLPTEKEKIRLFAKYIYINVLDAFAISPLPSVSNVDNLDFETVTIGSYSVKVIYSESRGLINEPGERLIEAAGVVFEVQTAESISPIPINFEIVFDSGTAILKVDIDLRTQNIENGRGGFKLTNGVQNNLEQNQDYWYTARYVFQDGHKTKTSFAVYNKTNNNQRLTVLKIQAAKDLDGTFADVEIFRKKSSSVFFLIDRLRNPIPLATGEIEYIDDGKLEQNQLDEQLYIWSNKHKTHAVTRDKYIRANLDYLSRENEIEGVLRIEETVNLDTFPPNSVIELVSRNRFSDGLLSFHKQIDKVSIPYDTEQIISYTGIPVLRSRNSDSKEVGWYYKYIPLESKFTTTYISRYLSNLNTPFYPDSEVEDIVKVNPTNPSFFVGYRYLYRRATQPVGQSRFYFADSLGEGESAVLNVFNVIDPVTQERVTDTREYVQVTGSGIFSPTSGLKIDMTINPFIYKKINDSTWEIANYENFQTLCQNQEIKGTLTSYQGGTNIPTTELQGIEFRILGFTDLSKTYNRQRDGVFPFSNPKIGRLYLEIETGTALDTAIDLERATISIPYLLSFKDGSDYKFVNTKPPSINENTLIYLGKDAEEFYPGVERFEQNNAVYWKLKESNIYETFVGINDLDNYQQDFPNQLIWSEPKLLGTNITGNRTFTFTNVLNIQSDYGDIIQIEPLGNRLIVFTERGVAIVVIGEQLTQTPSGETFVQGINFLNSPVWLLKNIEPVQLGTIKQYQNNLIFSDGVDVYRLGDQIENLSNGAIDLGVIRQTFAGYPSSQNRVANPAIMWATIDPKNREYRISNGTKTYCYNFDMGGWTGPHDYSETINVSFGDRSFGVVNAEIIEHNIGNTRSEKEYGPDGEYTTTIQSTSNDLGNAWITKLFRKFYIEQDGEATFSYSNDDSDYTDVDLSKSRTVAGLKHVGVQSQHQNSRYMFWKVLSKASDFVLKLLSFDYTPRNRR